MKQEDYGYSQYLKKVRIKQDPDDFETGRVIAEHKERYMVITQHGESDAEITGNMRFTAKNREDFPAAGDWVALTTFDHDFAIIHKIFPRYSLIKRQAVDQSGEVQVIAANIDVAFIVQAVDRDFNINRMERYLILCNASKISTVIVLSKIDLIDSQRLNEITEGIKARIKNVPVIAVSNETQNGYEAIGAFIKRGETYCLLGSSGVGKSTLLNNLAGKTIMKTDTISQRTGKGKHITSHRALFLLENGGILIDNPGMREVGITDSASGLDMTFDSIVNYARQCKFKDCSHAGEMGCAVLAAVEAGEISHASYENYLKLAREKAHFESTVAERRKKDRAFGKMHKDYKNTIKKNR